MTTERWRLRCERCGKPLHEHISSGDALECLADDEPIDAREVLAMAERRLHAEETADAG